MADWLLLIDDDRDNRELLSELLESDGYTVVSCGSAGDAQALLDVRGRPCLVLADILLPDMKGTTFVETMKARPGFEDTPVIFLTGIDSRTLEDRLEPVLMKPFDVAVLLDLVSERCPSRSAPPDLSSAD